MMQHAPSRRAFKMREGPDDGSFTDVASLADDHMRFNDDVGLYNGISRKKHRFRRDERYTAPHGSNAQPVLQFGFCLGKVGAVIYPKDFSLFDKAVSDLVTGVGCQSDDVGQVIFLFRIIVGNPPEEIEQQRHPAAMMPPLQRRIARSSLVASRSSTMRVMPPLSSHTTRP